MLSPALCPQSTGGETLSSLANDPLGMEGSPPLPRCIQSLAPGSCSSPSASELDPWSTATQAAHVTRSPGRRVLRAQPYSGILWGEDGRAYGRATLFIPPQTLISESMGAVPPLPSSWHSAHLLCICLLSHLKVSPANTGDPRGQAGGSFQSPSHRLWGRAWCDGSHHIHTA